MLRGQLQESRAEALEAEKTVDGLKEQVNRRMLPRSIATVSSKKSVAHGIQSDLGTHHSIDTCPVEILIDCLIEHISSVSKHLLFLNIVFYAMHRDETICT